MEDAKGALNNRVCPDHVSWNAPQEKKSWVIKSLKTNRDILRAGEIKLQKQRASGFTLQVNCGPRRRRSNHGLNGKHLDMMYE